MNMSRKELENLFKSYPDVVDIQQFREMLGGVCEGTARKLLQEHLVEHRVVRCTYYIPKSCIIDYLLSNHYKQYKKLLKHKVVIGNDKKPKKQNWEA